MISRGENNGIISQKNFRVICDMNWHIIYPTSHHRVIYQFRELKVEENPNIFQSLTVFDSHIAAKTGLNTFSGIGILFTHVMKTSFI